MQNAYALTAGSFPISPILSSPHSSCYLYQSPQHRHLRHVYCYRSFRNVSFTSVLKAFPFNVAGILLPFKTPFMFMLSSLRCHVYCFDCGLHLAGIFFPFLKLFSFPYVLLMASNHTFSFLFIHKTTTFLVYKKSKGSFSYCIFLLLIFNIFFKNIWSI